ncbi:MAG: hypothetical protein IKM20_06835 [Erysipelotrichales bacterium]|nr:hypothetical protein [Erysipelotrichales bacterium]
MSPKELSYIDDCLGHLEFLKVLCQDLESNVTDKEMKKLIKEMSTKFEEQFTTIYGLIGGEE